MRKQFYKYVIPSVLAFALSGVYAIVDGFFIGNSVGDIGLAAINVAYPITALIQAIGTGIGMGGSVELSVSIGKNDRSAQQKYFSSTIIMLVISSLLVMALLLGTSPLLLHLFGAEGELHSYAMEYLRVIVIGTVFQIMGTGLVPLIRNIGSSLSAMVAMLAGFATNIIGDYILVHVLSMGISGAGYATIAGQGLTMLICFVMLLRKRKFFRFPSVGEFIAAAKRIFLIGLSPFGLTFSPNMTLIVMNRSTIIYGGDNAVAAYAVIAYILCVVQLLLQGIGDGCQPILSRYYGEGSVDSLKFNKHLAYRFTFVVSIVCSILTYILRNGTAVLFGASDRVSEIISYAFPFFSSGFVFFGFTRVTTSYFYATQNSLPAYILIYGEPILLFILLLFIPKLMGIDGVWIATPIIQLVMAIISLILIKKHRTT